MRRVSMPKSQKCARWLVSTTVGFSELRCKGRYSNVSFLTLPYKLSNYFLLSDNQRDTDFLGKSNNACRGLTDSLPILYRLLYLSLFVFFNNGLNDSLLTT